MRSIRKSPERGDRKLHGILVAFDVPSASDEIGHAVLIRKVARATNPAFAKLVASYLYGQTVGLDRSSGGE